MRTSADGRLLCTSCDHHWVTIWETKTLREITAVQPGFSGGEQRLAIDPQTARILSGTWEEGLTCYDYSADRIIWRRADLIGIQQVALSPAFASSVFVALEAPDHRVDEPGIFTGIVELDARTGETQWQIEAANSIHLHPRMPVLVLTDHADRLVRIYDASRKSLGSTPMVHFAILDIAFQDDWIALAEGAKGIRIVALDGKVRTSCCPISHESNCLRVSFEGDQRVLNVFDSWDRSFITRLDATTGNVLGEYARENQTEVCFIDDGRRFVDACGQVCRSSDGRIEGHLDL
jgi:hypothetical protein